MDGENFFLNTVEGKIYAIYYSPTGNKKPNANVIIVSPFAEELNKSRKAISEFSRACAEINIGVLVIDLLGTGESEGDFRDAHWGKWKANIFSAYQWLRQRDAGSISCVGIRTGAILLLDAINSNDYELSKIIFWQPVVSGGVFLKQFLRLNLAADMMGAGLGKVTIQSLRDILASGKNVEVAGYELSSKLFHELDSLSLNNLVPPSRTQVRWFEIVSEKFQDVSPKKQQLVNRWRKENKIDAEIIAVRDEPFWATQEIVVPRNLIEITKSFFVNDNQS